MKCTVGTVLLFFLPVPLMFGFDDTATSHPSYRISSSRSSYVAGLGFCCLTYSVHNRIISTLNVSIGL